ncbi:glycosyltransferase family 1 protein [Microcoleus sp. FACHB-1515]|uniref:glycosyltransferase n=1 Tax=Cyanophyceae TaxID=3028117 RepID=UPI001685CB4E|nr:glycosyltransferase [Microcoleus sp. FACHB-1515]MBD2092466.1 glycosyltransferase family 1 protein [Microcoleus sp. FACHB-1515]
MIRSHRITILAIGSTGDLYPFCALALGLQQAGHHVRVATNSNFETFVRGLGLDFAAIAGDFQALLKSELGQKLLQGERVKLIEDDLLRQQMYDALNAAQDAEVFIFNQLTLWGYHVAEKLNIPCFLASSVPFSATQNFPFLSFSEDPNLNLFKGWLNYGSYLLIELISTWQSRALIDHVRQEWGLPSLPTLGARFRWDQPRYLAPLPILYGVSPSIFRQPKDWNDSIDVTGAWFLDRAEEYEPPIALTQFLEAGETPICVGFGSMTDSTETTSNIVLEAIALSKQRAIILSGWSGLGKIELVNSLKQQVFVIDSVPHSWLFSKVKAVVHHGGSGTTAAVCRAGLPSVVVPYFADQNGWGDRLHQLGVSPKPIPRKQLTVESLANAIAIVTSNQTMQQKSAQLGLSIRNENGVDRAVAIIEQSLQSY